MAAPRWAPELGVMSFPSMTSMYQRSSLYEVLFAASPSERPKSKGARAWRAFAVWMAASRTCVV